MCFLLCLELLECSLAEVHHHPNDCAREGERRFVCIRDRRTGVAADIEAFVGRIKPADLLLETTVTNLVLSEPQGPQHDAVGWHAMLNDAIRKLALPVRPDEGMVAALAAGRSCADIEKVVDVAVGDLKRPIAVRDIRRGQGDRLILELDDRTAVYGIVVRVNGMTSLAVAKLCMCPISIESGMAPPQLDWLATNVHLWTLVHCNPPAG
jgi:hypothetical protein